MSEATAAPAAGVAPSAAAEAPKGTGAPATAAAQEELIDLLLEEGKPPLKVPASKLNPHLAKYRSETDKLRSEYDKNAKALGERTSKLEAVLKAAKEDTDGMLRELGVDPDEYAERRLSSRVAAALREAEEKANPEKKNARERDEELERLRKDKADREKTDAQKQREGMMTKLRGAIDAAVAKLPEQLRGDAAPDVIAVFRQAIAEKRDISIDDAAKAALAVMRARARAAYEADEELRKGLGGVPPAPKPGAKIIEHPASKPTTRDERGKFKPLPENDGAGDVLQKIARGKF